jgi:hypothetical protein
MTSLDSSMNAFLAMSFIWYSVIHLDKWYSKVNGYHLQF